MQISVQRIWSVPDNAEHRATTTGTLSLDGVQTCFTLERNEVLCPAGTYGIKLQWSERFQRKTPWLEDVPGHTAVELHGGNHAEDSDMCILCAMKRLDDYTIAESKPATDLIEMRLAQAESAGETNTITVS